MFKLKDLNSFAEGDLRKCYIHPQHPNLCIKVQKKDALADQNTIEKWYYSILKFRKVNYQNVLPKFNGVVSTDIGEGLVFELVMDSDGKRSRSISEYVKQNLLTLEQAKALINKLSDSLVARSIILDDKNPENVLLKKDEKGQFIPILIDGFGAKRLGIKFIVGALIPSYARFKTKKRAKQLIIKMNDELA